MYKTRSVRNKKGKRKSSSNKKSPGNQEAGVTVALPSQPELPPLLEISDSYKKYIEFVNNADPNFSPTLKTATVTTESIYPIFLNEPFHTNLTVNDEMVASLKGDKWLTTSFIDFLLKHALPRWKTQNFLLPTSDVQQLLAFYNEAAQSTAPDDVKLVEETREGYKFFSTQIYVITMLSFVQGFYYVISMNFDPNDVEGDFFQRITIYDNLKRSSRYGGGRVNKQNSAAINLLEQFQLFCKNYILHNSKHKQLLEDPTYIWQSTDISYPETPKQEVTHDSALFGLAVVMHLSRSLHLKEDSFSQKHVTYLRKSLHIILNATVEDVGTDSRKFIDRDFLCSFFPKTFQKNDKPNHFLHYLYKFNTMYKSPIKEKKSPTKNKNASVAAAVVDYMENKESSIKKNLYASGTGATIRNEDCASSPKLNNPQSTINDDYEDDKKPAAKVKTNNIEAEEQNIDGNVDDDDISLPSDLLPISPYDDLIFEGCFVEDPFFTSPDELTARILKYQSLANIKVASEKTNPKTGYRYYKCVSHLCCPFYASFGPRRGDKKLMLKKFELKHEGFDRGGKYSYGHKLKEPIASTVAPAIEHVKLVKFGKPVANDVKKASRAVDGLQPTSKQANKVLAYAAAREKVEARKNYQYIIPYLNAFKNENPGTVIDYERDDTKSIKNLFICPGVMNNKLKYVRPILSLDAAHLSSEHKGTLYLATIKSGNDELLPIALGITSDNENLKGWTFFLKNLNEACPFLKSEHTLRRCAPYKLYTFISDRDKGLLPSAHNIFPGNLHTNCLFHIRQNVVQNYGGMKAGQIVHDLGKNYSMAEEEQLFEKLRKTSVRGETYVRKLPFGTWKSTDWIRNPNLPPRYGILDSNSSEAMNAMFKEARSCSWFACMDKILHSTQVRIATFRNQYKDKRGLIVQYKKDYQELFNQSASYDIISNDDDGTSYKVYWGKGDDYNHTKTHIINLDTKMCTCGVWQDTELLCVHIMCYYRSVEGLSFKEVLELPHSPYYSYNTLGKLYKDNIKPVIVHQLESDNETLPPPLNNKRQAGRPAIRRKRKRSKTEKTVVCSKCRKPGHNAIGCNEPVGVLQQSVRTQNVGEHNSPDLFAETFAVGNSTNANSDTVSEIDQVKVAPKKKGRPKKNKPFERNEESFL